MGGVKLENFFIKGNVSKDTPLTISPFPGTKSPKIHRQSNDHSYNWQGTPLSAKVMHDHRVPKRGDGRKNES